MTQIKIEVPANDHIALSAMADALQRIATERAPSVTDLCDKPFEETATKVDVNGTEYRSLPGNLKDVEVECTFSDEELEASIHHENTKLDEAFEEAVESINDIEPTPTEQDDTLDADGLPWDKRIHSRGKTRLSDDTWRLARKPNDKTDDEWTTYVESVKSELKAVQDIPVTPPVVDEPTSEPTLDEQAVADLTPPVVEEPTAPTLTPPVIDTEAPVAPVTPPTSLTPPVVEPTVEPVEAPSDQPSVTTFQELMLYITGNAKKRGADNDMIKSTLAEVDPALTAIPLIATRADLIPKFVTALEAKLS